MAILPPPPQREKSKLGKLGKAAVHVGVPTVTILAAMGAIGQLFVAISTQDRTQIFAALQVCVALLLPSLLSIFSGPLPTFLFWLASTLGFGPKPTPNPVPTPVPPPDVTPPGPAPHIQYHDKLP